MNPPADLAAERATASNFSAPLLGLAGIALLVGGISVANTMFQRWDLRERT